MLANGTRLFMKKKGEDDYKELPGLKETPEVGITPEKVENTGLNDPFKMNELGIGELPDMVYKLKFDNSSADSPYRKLRECQKTGETVSFQEKLKDGTTTEFDATLSVKRTGGGVNGVIDVELTVYPQTDFEITDPV